MGKESSGLHLRRDLMGLTLGRDLTDLILVYILSRMKCAYFQYQYFLSGNINFVDLIDGFFVSQVLSVVFFSRGDVQSLSVFINTCLS